MSVIRVGGRHLPSLAGHRPRAGIDRHRSGGPLDWPYAALRPAGAGMERSVRRVDRRQDEDVLRLLDDRLADSVSAELTFAEWFSRWDSGPWPVVIDRIALSSAGLGPKSQCVPTSANAEGPKRGPGDTQAARVWRLFRSQTVFVITTEAERPRLEPRDRWAEPFAEALVWGSDRTDRFQTPGALAGRAVAQARRRRSAKRRPRGSSCRQDGRPGRFEGPSWPEEDAFVYLIDVRAVMFDRMDGRRRVSSGMGLVSSSVGRWRFLVLTIAHGIRCLYAEWLLPLRYAFYGAAVYLAAFGLLLSELGHVLGRPFGLGSRVSRSESSLVAPWGGRGRVRGARRSVVGRTVAAVRRRRQGKQGSAILALFPYEGPFDPAGRPAT